MLSGIPGRLVGARDGDVMVSQHILVKAKVHETKHRGNSWKDALTQMFHCVVLHSSQTTQSGPIIRARLSCKINQK